jgi:hypothetical protein
VLRPFTPQKPRWTISELARHLNVPKSGIFRLVKTFERKNFFQSSEDSYEYGLGSGIWELTGTVFGKRERLMVKHLDCNLFSNRFSRVLLEVTHGIQYDPHFRRGRPQ